MKKYWVNFSASMLVEVENSMDTQEKFWGEVNFSASVLIEAKDNINAQEKFWDWVNGNLPSSGVLEHVQVDTIKEVRATAEPPWKKRCRNCEYQFEDYDGEWRCANQWEEACKNIEECVDEE